MSVQKSILRINAEGEFINGQEYQIHNSIPMVSKVAGKTFLSINRFGEIAFTPFCQKSKGNSEIEQKSESQKKV
ncbi:MAG: hypothetical protein PVI40_02675 [Chlamydiota bacterium]|jgi:hypothetical protein